MGDLASPQDVPSRIRRGVPAILGSAGIATALLLYMGRKYLEAYYSRLGVPVDALDFSPQQLAFASEPLVLVSVSSFVGAVAATLFPIEVGPEDQRTFRAVRLFLVLFGVLGVLVILGVDFLFGTGRAWIIVAAVGLPIIIFVTMSRVLAGGGSEITLILAFLAFFLFVVIMPGQLGRVAAGEVLEDPNRLKTVTVFVESSPRADAEVPTDEQLRYDDLRLISANDDVYFLLQPSEEPKVLAIPKRIVTLLEFEEP